MRYFSGKNDTLRETFVAMEARRELYPQSNSRGAVEKREIVQIRDLSLAFKVFGLSCGAKYMYFLGGCWGWGWDA